MDQDRLWIYFPLTNTKIKFPNVILKPRLSQNPVLLSLGFEDIKNVPMSLFMLLLVCYSVELISIIPKTKTAYK